VAHESDDIARQASSTVSRSWPKSLCDEDRRTVFPVRWWVTSMSRSNFPEQTRTNAMRSRCFGSMFAWILKTNDENFGCATGTSTGSEGCGVSPSAMVNVTVSGFFTTAALRRGCGVTVSLRNPSSKRLDAEIIHRAAEVDRRLLAGLHGAEVEGMPGAVEHRELLGDLLIGVVVELRAHDGVFQRSHVHRRLVSAARDALETSAPRASGGRTRRETKGRYRGAK